MITILRDSPNIAARGEVLPILERSYIEVRELLPELPAKLRIWLLNENTVESTGVGGFAYSPATITIHFDQHFEHKHMQEKALRATLFHEAAHVVQGHTDRKNTATYRSALDNAIYEGIATVFERTYADYVEPYGDYGDISPELLAQWRDELAAISYKDFTAKDGKLWRSWAFYDHDDGQQWKLYRVGAWLADTYLNTHGNDILAAVRLQANEIYP